jgi:hypothetical protein
MKNREFNTILHFFTTWGTGFFHVFRFALFQNQYQYTIIIYTVIQHILKLHDQIPCI